MNVLHIISGKFSGGAARGALWLHLSQLESGINSTILNNSRMDSSVRNAESIIHSRSDMFFSIIRREIDKLPTYFYRKRKNYLYSTALTGFDVTKTQLYHEADIIHLHWINGFINLKNISMIEKPLVWTMRDMWPFTGGCHVALDCDRYISGCGKCPQLNSTSQNDFSHNLISKKIRLIPKHIKPVGISNWLTTCAQESLVFKDFGVQTIHNGINLDDFFPVDKVTAREILGINNLDKPIVLVGGQQYIAEKYKGFHKFIEALNYLEQDKFYFIFFGGLDTDLINKQSIKYLNLGFLHDNISLRLAYSAADIFVAPSLMDSFGKTLAESIACGTPVVCFDATGPKDIIDHKICGYKAVPYEATDLAAGIDWVLADKQRHKQLCENGREKAATSFDISKIARQYYELYQSII